MANLDKAEIVADAKVKALQITDLYDLLTGNKEFDNVPVINDQNSQLMHVYKGTFDCGDTDGKDIIQLPAGAVEIVINSDNDVMFSEHSSFSSYDRIPAGIPENIGIVRRDNLYLKNTGAGSIVVYFHFVIL